MNGLTKWLNVFNETGATPVYIPQYHSWANNEWRSSNETKWYEWLKRGLDELLPLKETYENLQIQPIIQGMSYGQQNKGPNHQEMHQQLRIVFDHEAADGVWILAWSLPSFPHNPIH